MTHPPSLPATTARQDADATLRRRCAGVFLLAGAFQFACAALATAWLARDWNTAWHDKTFVDSVYLSYGGFLIYAFGKWSLMAVLVLYLAAGALLLTITAAVFRASSRPRLHSALAVLCLLVVPAGTLAGLHARRRPAR